VQSQDSGYTIHRSVSAGTTEIDGKDGIASLRGDAAGQVQKELTTEFAKDVEGLKDGNNEMTVTKTSKKMQTVGKPRSDCYGAGLNISCMHTYTIKSELLYPFFDD
jgi:osmotically-inducible protein OsmY